MIKKKNFFPAIIVAAIVIFLMVIIIVLQSQINALNRQYDELNAELERHQDLVDELNYEFTLSEKEYIEKYAREVLGYHKFSDIIIKSESDG